MDYKAILTNSAIGAITLLVVLKIGNMLAPTFKAGKGTSWVGSTSAKGLIFQGVIGAILMNVLGYVSKAVTQIRSKAGV